MGEERELEAWSILLRAPGLGPRGVRGLIDCFGNAPAAVTAGDRRLADAGVPQAARAFIATPDRNRIAADLAWLAEPGHHLIRADSEDFPALLAQSPQPPAALYVDGDPDLLWHPQIAVIGSRNPSAAGRDHARAFAGALARSGLLITSGMADGIDAEAHRAALAAGRPTIAVVGSGVDIVYPRKHRTLAAEIATAGAVVSEFPLGVEPRPDHFPRRNRIIAGLSLGTLVVEASLRSGSLITARLASDAGREVFALPGSLHNPMARGCHRLIRDGARLVETADEIVGELEPLAAKLAGMLRSRLEKAAPDPHPGAGSTADEDDDADYRRLLDALGHDPATVDELVTRSGLTVESVSSMLLMLELQGRVASGGGGRYVRAA
ncbi:MAG TPA: DNA-processing protein DprA [Xanthomonadaceae bacterium]|nr:DNA-processing protein DprA [Xanthomonadaceae bacterium]